MNGASDPEEVRRRVVESSCADGEFRQRLVSDPKGTIEKELGAPLPDGIEEKVVEETPGTIYLVLPPSGPSQAAGGELSDRELEAVAGGWHPTLDPCGTRGPDDCGAGW